MSVNDSNQKLKRASKDLFAGWHQIERTWRDQNRNEFEKKYLAPLRSELRKVELAMERFDSIINHIRNDCK